MSLQFRRFQDPAAFSERAGAFLMEREDLNSLYLGIIQRLIRRGPYEPNTVTLLMTVEEAGEIIGIVMRTPPFKLLVSDLPPHVAGRLVDVVHEVYDVIPAVLGVRAAATAVAEAWDAKTGVSHAFGMEQALHRLDHLEEPPPISGGERTATDDDVDLLLGWIRAFYEDVHLAKGRVKREDVEAVLGNYVLWEVDGEPVSLAGHTAGTPNGARVGPVYTPRELRGRGYGTAVTAAVTRNLLADGKRFVVLYTDLANPTSNKIYHSLGYRVIAEVVDIVFDAR